MSRSSTIFRLVEPRVPGARQCGDLLVVAPPGYHVAGFLLETTTRKNMVYLWRVIMTLFKPMRNLSVNYSVRIANGEPVLVDPLDMAGSADNIRQIILHGHVEYLRRIRTLDDFLKHAFPYIDAAQKDPLPELWHAFQFDFCAAHFLLGNEAPAMEGFQRLDKKTDQMSEAVRTLVSPPIKAVIQTYERDPAGVKALLDSWVTGNLQKFKLEEALALVAARSLAGAAEKPVDGAIQAAAPVEFGRISWTRL